MGRKPKEKTVENKIEIDVIKKSNSKSKETKSTKSKVKETLTEQKNQTVNKKEETKQKKPKEIKKKYTEDRNFWYVNKLILRIQTNEANSEEFIKEFKTETALNKDKLNKKTKYKHNQWGQIIDIKTDEENLVFILKPINNINR